MDLLQILNREDLESLADRFGDGLDEAQFVSTMQSLVAAKAKANPREYGMYVKKWKSSALRELFQTIDYNQDGTLQYHELTNFAINSALHHTKNQSQRVELQFRPYELVLPPQPTSYGSTTVTNAGNFSTMSDQILTGRGHFKDQSAQLRQLFYLKGCRRFVAEGFTRVTLHAASDPEPLSRLEITGRILDVTTAHNNTYLVCSTDQNLMEVFEQGSSAVTGATRFLKRKALNTNRAITQFLKADSGLGALPSWFGGTGDREGLIRYCNMERLHAQLTLLGHHLDSLTIARRKLHTDEISSLHFLNSRVGGESIISSAHDNRIVVHDVESGVVRFEPLHDHRTIVKQVALSNIHNLGFSIGNDSFACVFNLDYMQRTVVKLDDFKDPHAHKLVGVHCVTDTHQVITADAGGMLKLWDVRQLRAIRSFHVPPLEVDAITVGQKLKHQRSYGVPDAKPLPQGSVRTEIQVQQKCALLHSTVFCDETKRIYAIGKETTVFQYDTSTMVPKAHSDPLVAIAYNEREETLLTASAQELKLWNIRTGCCVSSLVNPFSESEDAVCSIHITCLTIDHLGGKRVFVGSSKGHVACLIPATGKSEWTVPARIPPVGVVRQIIFSVKYLFVGFTDGTIVSLEVLNPLNVPRVVFEPGTSLVVQPILHSSPIGPGELLSPSSVHRRQSVGRRKSRIRRVSQAGGPPSQIQLQAAAESNSAAHAPAEQSLRQLAPPAVFCDSSVLQLFVMYAPHDRSLLGMEYGARACFSIAQQFSSPITAMCFVKESPWVAPVTQRVAARALHLVPANKRNAIRGDPKSCELSLLAVGQASGVLHIYSIHMAEPTSKLTSCLLMSIDVLDGVSINSICCVQDSYIVAAVDSNELAVWKIEPLLAAAAAFDLPVLTRVTSPAAVRFGDIVKQLNATPVPDERRTVSPSLNNAEAFQAQQLRLAEEWVLRMQAVVNAIAALHESLPMGTFEVADQTFVSHCVKIADSGVVVCASGELDSIARVVTIDGEEIGMLALGRTEEDAQDAVNSQKRNQQRVRDRVEVNLLKTSNSGTQSPTNAQEGQSSPQRQLVSPQLTSRPLSQSSNDDSVVGVRSENAVRQHALSPPRDTNSPLSSTQQFGPPSPTSRHTSAYAPYFWENVFNARPWRNPKHFMLPHVFHDGDAAESSTGEARLLQGRSLVPPALSSEAIRQASTTTIYDRDVLHNEIPELVIDFTKIQQHHLNEEDEGWMEVDQREADGLEDVFHLATLKKALKKIQKRIRVLRKRKLTEVPNLEINCPEAVKRLADREWDEEMTKLLHLNEMFEREVETAESLAAGNLMLAGHSVNVGEQKNGQLDSKEAAFNTGSQLELDASLLPSPRKILNFLPEDSMRGETDTLNEGSTVAFGNNSSSAFSGEGMLSQSSSSSAPQAAAPAEASSLADLARRRHSVRIRELESQLAAVGIPFSITSHRPKVSAHHTDLCQMPGRLVSPPVHQSNMSRSPKEKRLPPEGPVVLLQEGVPLLDEPTPLPTLSSIPHPPLTLHNVVSQIHVLNASPSSAVRVVPARPVVMPPEAGVRDVAPKDFCVDTKLMDALLRDSRLAVRQAKNAAPGPQLHTEAMTVHSAGELSTRGALLKHEADAATLRRQYSKQKALEAFKKRNAHVRETQLNELIAQAASGDGNASPSAPKLPARPRSPASRERVHNLVFPPISSPRGFVHCPSNTARTATAVPAHVCGILRVSAAQFAAPNTERHSRDEGSGYHRRL